MKKNILLVEDDLTQAESLSFELEKEGFVTFIANTFQTALRFFEQGIDISAVIIDLNLHGENCGDKIGKLASQKGIPFFYLTGMLDQKVIDNALEVNAQALFTKPFRIQEIASSLKLVLQSKPIVSDLTPAHEKKSLFIREKRMTFKVDFDDLLLVEAANMHVFVFTKNRKYVVRQSLSKFAQQLPSKPFLRVHRSFIINIDKIEMIDHHLIVIGKHRIPVTKTYKKVFNDLVLS